MVSFWLCAFGVPSKPKTKLWVSYFAHNALCKITQKSAGFRVACKMVGPMFISDCKQHEGRGYMSYFLYSSHPNFLPASCSIWKHHNSYLWGLHWSGTVLRTLLILSYFVFTMRRRYTDSVKYAHVTDEDLLAALPCSVISVPES